MQPVPAASGLPIPHSSNTVPIAASELSMPALGVLLVEEQADVVPVVSAVGRDDGHGRLEHLSVKRLFDRVAAIPEGVETPKASALPEFDLIDRREEIEAQRFCFCTPDDPRVGCRLPDIYIPRSLADRSVKHLPIVNYSEDRSGVFCFVGIELEYTGLAFSSESPIAKKQVLARTAHESFGYPCISVTADTNGIIEIVTAPMRLEQIKDYQLKEKLGLLMRSLWEESGEKISVIGVIEKVDKRLDGAIGTSGGFQMFVPGTSVFLPGADEVKCVSFFDGSKVFLCQRNISQGGIYEFQTNFFMPYNRLVHLRDFLGGEHALKCDSCLNSRARTGKERTLNYWISCANKIFSKYKTLVNGFWEKNVFFKLLSDSSKDCLDSFLFHQAYNLLFRYSSFLMSYRSDVYFMGFKCLPLAPRISLQQEVMSVIDDSVASVLLGIEKDLNQLVDVAVNSISGFRDFYVGKEHKLEEYIDWCNLYVDDLRGLLRMRNRFGACEVFNENSVGQYIKKNGREIPLPVKDAEYLINLGADDESYFGHVLQPVKVYGKYWIVVEYRSLDLAENHALRFNEHIDWMEGLNTDEQIALSSLWGKLFPPFEQPPCRS